MIHNTARLPLPALVSAGAAGDLRSGKQLIGADGSIVTGTMPEVAGKTITPGTTAQTAVAAGRYITGDVVVAGDANLVPANIAQGVSIFGVTGTHSGGASIETCTITINATSRFAEIKVYALDADTMDTVYAVAEQRGTASVVLTVVKNSIILFYATLDYGTLSITGSYVSIEKANYPGCIEATGDVTISG